MKRISTRLAVSFLIVALLPTLPLSLVVRDLLERRFGPTIADPLETGLEAGLEESRLRLKERRVRLRLTAAKVAERSDVVLLDVMGGVQPPDSLRAVTTTRPDLLTGVQDLAIPDGQTVAVPERRGDFLVTVVARQGRPPAVVLQPLPAGMVGRAGDMSDGLGLLRVVRDEQSRVVLSFVAPFLLVYGVLILIALGAGLLWSRQMVRPLEKLVGATRRVAGGDLEFRVEADGPGEVGELVRSFDAMVGRLAEQRRDLARLERAAAWRGMARTLAHEVKNPLTPILLSVQQTRDNYRGEDPRYRAQLEECVEIVTEEVESLRRLVREFSQFARLPRPVPVEGDLVDLMRDLDHLYGDRLELDLKADTLVGWFDAVALRRALVNLIDNGLAACTEVGVTAKITLTLDRADPGADIQVADRGAGIPAENLDRIFEPDFTTKGDGMGLGLAVVQGIVAGHGGTVRVESVPDRGTTFTLHLPLTSTRSPKEDES